MAQFSPFSTSIAPDFWHSLTRLKLQVLKLSDEPVSIQGSYTRGRTMLDRQSGETIGFGSIVELDGNAFEKDEETKLNSEKVKLKGILRNYNTIEDFRNCDKSALLDTLSQEIWARSNVSGVTIEELSPFIMITFADLKKFKYWYWCGFPAFLQKPGWEVQGEFSTLEESETISIREEQNRHSCFLSRNIDNKLEYAPISDASNFFASVPDSSRALVFLDPSTHHSAFGWSLRNVLTYLSTKHEISTIRVIGFRDSENTIGKSRVAVLFRVVDSEADRETRPSAVGWEKNDKGKLGPRLADLAPLMDPTRLADQAVDLNLQLMRWRIMPALNLEKVKETTVLLLGAGTLGCYVARTLMAWGVRKITLVDSSTVSFSNPVRQPLFEFEDSLEGGKPKAQAAAASLRRIYPGVDATGVTLSIPMPGHPIFPNLVDKAREDVKTLEALIDSHDVVYLLMDSRESRWLPTVIGASKRKLIMNVALGFDTYLVMRHGVISDLPSPVQIPGTGYTGRLGCYYCNDVVAPMDSLTDRTLDQMCTVTRPGIAGIASATAVELMVSVLQHPQGSLAISDIPLVNSNSSQTNSDAETSSPLGIVPHQIRGFLAQFNNLKITGQAYDKCTGCSDTIVQAYENRGFEMLLEAFNDANSLEKLTGLDVLAAESDAMMEGVDWDEEDEE